MDKQLVYKAQKEAEDAWVHYRMMEDCTKKALSDYNAKLIVFRKLDKELAAEDGRLIKLPSAGEGKRKPQKPAELTLDQIKEIAKRLGVSVVEDEEIINEELTELVEEFENERKEDSEDEQEEI